ncbi:DEKNAAC102215 [Brettanomyces naardenensis]|uniref:DEKNAAC102215 n=1 Tax=Brettanomyces naardenensis TaxID=13370 RepID=A0A448YL51_BRENA|nr:DEKNAAC102215 [Brettanomyces naardenensis]
MASIYLFDDEELSTDVSDVELGDQSDTAPSVLEPSQPKEQRQSFFARLRLRIWQNDGFWGKVLLITSISSAIVILAFECFLFGLFAKNIDSIQPDRPQAVDASWKIGKRNAVATYLALYIYAEIYQVMFTLLILYTKNIYHLLSYLVFLCAMAVYSGIQFYELNYTLLYNLLSDSTWEKACKGIAIAVIAVSCLVCVIQGINARKLRIAFIKITGEKVGNRTSLINSNIVFNLHRNALIVTGFFLTAFTLQFAVIVLNKNDPEFAITIVVLALSYLIIVLADYGAVREKSIFLYLSFIAYMGGLAYLIFKLYRLFTRYATMPGKRSLVAFDIFCILLVIWLMVLSVLVRLNFGKGLKTIYEGNYHFARGEAEETKFEPKM